MDCIHKRVRIDVVRGPSATYTYAPIRAAATGCQVTGGEAAGLPAATVPTHKGPKTGGSPASVGEPETRHRCRGAVGGQRTRT